MHYIRMIRFVWPAAFRVHSSGTSLPGTESSFQHTENGFFIFAEDALQHAPRSKLRIPRT